MQSCWGRKYQNENSPSAFIRTRYTPTIHHLGLAFGRQVTFSAHLLASPQPPHLHYATGKTHCQSLCRLPATNVWRYAEHSSPIRAHTTWLLLTLRGSTVAIIHPHDVLYRKCIYSLQAEHLKEKKHTLCGTSMAQLWNEFQQMFRILSRPKQMYYSS